MLQPFHWQDGATVTITAGTTGTDRGALLKMPTGKTQIRIYNAGTTTVFMKKGTDATVTAALTDFPVAAGAVEVLTLTNLVASPVSHFAAIVASGSATLYITTGQGI